VFWPFKRKPKEDWRLVTTLAWDALHNKTTKIVVFVHLYESNEGNRKYKVGSTLSGWSTDDLEKGIVHLESYHTTLVPWLEHRFVPNIPRYHDVEGIDVQRKLTEE
jgi:hypothetical protein